MPIVTSIKQQKKNGARFSIYLDGVYAFALSDLEVSTSGIRVGNELTEEDAQSYRESSIEFKAYSLALGYLSLRPHSKREMELYLRRKGYERSIIQGVLGRLAQHKLIDDADFAKSWVESRRITRPRSRRHLREELMAKGVSGDDIEHVLSEYDAEAELEGLQGLIRRKQRLSQYQDKGKLVAYLSRQGYGYDLIQRALTNISLSD